MLTQVAEGVLVHQSEILQNNTVVVQGRVAEYMVFAASDKVPSMTGVIANLTGGAIVD